MTTSQNKGNQTHHKESPHIAQKDQCQKDLLKLSPTEGSEKKESSFPLHWDVNGYRKYAKQHKDFFKKKKKKLSLG